MPNRVIEIPAPQFELYEFVTLHWNEQERQVKVVRRWFNLDDNQWCYKIQGSEILYPENAFSVEAVS